MMAVPPIVIKTCDSLAVSGFVDQVMIFLVSGTTTDRNAAKPS